MYENGWLQGAFCTPSSTRAEVWPNRRRYKGVVSRLMALTIRWFHRLLRPCPLTFQGAKTYPEAMALLAKQRKIIDLFYHLSTPPMQEGAGEIGDDIDARLQNLGQTPRRVIFCVFHEKHLSEATDLYEILIGNEQKDTIYFA